MTRYPLSTSLVIGLFGCAAVALTCPILPGGTPLGEAGAVAEYVIHYADGGTQTVPLVTGRTADDWALPPEAEEAFVGLKGNPWHLNVLGVKLRDVTIEKVIFRDLGTPAAPVLVAMTLVY